MTNTINTLNKLWIKSIHIIKMKDQVSCYGYTCIVKNCKRNLHFGHHKPPCYTIDNSNPVLHRGISSLKIAAPANDTEEHLQQKIRLSQVKGLPIVHHHGYVSSLPVKHRFAMRKFHGVMRFLKKDQVISSKQIFKPGNISKTDMCTVHDDRYIEQFLSGETTTQEQRLTGFEWSDGLVSRCLCETGGTLMAAKIALEVGVACSTGGGTHHAFPGYGSGYCLINDMGVTAATLLREGSVERVLIVDLDVHQGDGTAVMFQDNNNVFTLSMHCDKNFPSKKQESDLDIALDVGLEDKAYMDILRTHLPWVLQTFRPDLILYDAGVDPHSKDELGKLKLSDQGLYDRDFYVIDLANDLGIPIATVIGGGYQRDLEALSVRHTIIHRAATQVWNASQMKSFV